MSKQDRQGARTPADLERKYGLGGLGKRFAEVLGKATDARKTVERVEGELSEQMSELEKDVKFQVEKELEHYVKASDYNAFKSKISALLDLVRHNAKGKGLVIGDASEVEGTVVNGLALQQTGNRYSYQSGNFDGEKGYTAVAVINITGINVDAPITFVINKRGALRPMSCYIRFGGATVDPELSSFVYDGDDYGAFLKKTAPSVWTLYVDNESGQSELCIIDWYTSKYNEEGMSVDFPNEQISKLIEPWSKALPAVPQNIIECIMPVGFVLTLYSHADPNTMYPGTTWERIQNAFLWAIDGSGTIGQTGGEKTVTLNEAQLPKHNHGGTYTNAGDATKTYDWLAPGGSAMTYDTVDAGGGEAHNNMPPYVQVSVWRRTA